MPSRPTERADRTRERPLIAVAMVNWNGADDTLTAFESLKQSSYPAWSLIVVDNASADDSVAKLRAARGLRLVESAENLGFAGGCNLAIPAARELGAQYLFFLNNDATVNAETLENLVAASRTLDDREALGAVIRFERDGTLQFWGSRASAVGMPIWSPPSEALFAQAPELIETNFIMGASLFVPMQLLDEVGPFDERFFLNYEETDWCYRARRAGHRCLMVKNALITHKGGAAIGAASGPMQVYFMRRNALLLAEKHCTPKQYATLYVRQVASIFTRLLGSMLGRRDDPRFSKLAVRANALATRDYILRRFGDCPPIIRKMATAGRASH